MNKTVIGGIVGVLVLGAVAVLAINFFSREETAAPTPTQDSISRPAVKPVANTFSIMTPEEKAASEEAARVAAEAALLASTTGSSSDTEENREEEVEDEEQIN